MFNNPISSRTVAKTSSNVSRSSAANGAAAGNAGICSPKAVLKPPHSNAGATGILERAKRLDWRVHRRYSFSHIPPLFRTMPLLTELEWFFLPSNYNDAAPTALNENGSSRMGDRHHRA